MGQKAHSLKGHFDVMHFLIERASGLGKEGKDEPGEQSNKKRDELEGGETEGGVSATSGKTTLEGDRRSQALASEQCHQRARMRGARPARICGKGEKSQHQRRSPNERTYASENDETAGEPNRDRRMRRQ